MEKKCKNMYDYGRRKATIGKIFRLVGTKSLIFFTMTAFVLIGTIFVFENDVHATSKTRDEAINWLYSVEGHPFDVDGAYGIQCADLAMAYYEYLGEARPYGNGCDYFTNALPSGWERYANTPDFIPEPGDVVSWDSSWGGGAGHVAIVLSATVNSLTVMEQNGTNHTPTHRKTYNSYSHVQGFNRPNFTESDSEKPSVTNAWFEPHNHTELMLKATATDNSGVASVRAYYKKSENTDWHSAEMLLQPNGEWHVFLNAKDGYGNYDIHIYATDNAGNSSNAYGVWTAFDNSEPSIENYDVIDIDDTGFTLTGEYRDNESSMESIDIAVWTENNGQDDLQWVVPDSYVGNRFYKRINFSDHNGERSVYALHMYAKNKALLRSLTGYWYEPIYESVKTLEKDGHIYALYDNALSWENAKKKAEEYGGHLATINSKEEQALLSELLTSSGSKKGYWLGGYKDTQWKWITGEEFSCDHWASNQPDNAQKREDKLMAFKNDDFEIGSWNDAWNEDYVGMGFVIEYEPQLDNAIVTKEQDGHIYKLFRRSMEWNKAKAECESLGGHLMTITSDAEQKLLAEMIGQAGGKYWLGGQRNSQSVFEWITGEPMTFTKWALGQPDNNGNNESVMGTYSTDGNWNDFPENYTAIDGYILEIEQPLDGENKSVVYNGKKYIRYDMSLPWNEAQKFCESQGGNLAMAKDAEIQKVLTELTQNGRKFYFLGLTNLQDNKWKWLDNSDMNHSNWDDQEPTNTGNIEHYVAMVGKTGKWRDVAMNLDDMTQMGFICEVPYEANVEQVTLDQSELLLNVGDSGILKAAVMPENASDKKLKWDSNNTGIATVDQSGKVTAIAAGQAKVTATSVNGKQASCTVTVNPAVPADVLQVKGACDRASVRPGDTVTITINLENYAISEEEISSLQIEIPNGTDELTYVPDSKKLLLETGEFSANENIIFAYLPLSAGDNVLPKDTKGLFSFQMKVSGTLTEDMDAKLPMTITMGDKDDESIMEGVVENIIVPIRKMAIIKGDLNGRNGVDILDARKAKRAAMKEVALTDYELQAGDLNGDGVVTIIEARKIKRAAMKEITL